MQAPSFTAREHTHELLLVAALKVKASEIGARGHRKLSDLKDVLAVGDRVKHGLVVRERIAKLRDSRQLHGVAEHNFTRVRFFLAVYHLKERRLTGAVGTDHTHNGARGHREGKVVNQQAVAEPLRDVMKLNDFVPEALCDRNKDFIRFIAALIFVA